MNIIEVTREILNNFKGIGQFFNPESIHIDYTDSIPESYGLSSVGDTLISEDILGNETRQHSFILYSVNHSYNDYSRLANSSFLLNLGYYLEKVKGNEFEVFVSDANKEIQTSDTGITKRAWVTKVTSANAMMFEVLDGDMNQGVRYQLQITVQYKVESEGI